MILLHLGASENGAPNYLTPTKICANLIELNFGGEYGYSRYGWCFRVLYYIWVAGFSNLVNMDNGDIPTPEWAILGAELLEGAMSEAAYIEAARLLRTPGVDPALYMLFCALPQGQLCIENKDPTGTWSITEVRSLMQCAFMLGTYVRKSIEEAEKLW